MFRYLFGKYHIPTFQNHNCIHIWSHIKIGKHEYFTTKFEGGRQPPKNKIKYRKRIRFITVNKYPLTFVHYLCLTK